MSLAQICNFFISSASTRQRVTTAQAVAKRDDCISAITLANPSSLPRAATFCLLYDKKLSKALTSQLYHTSLRVQRALLEGLVAMLEAVDFDMTYVLEMHE